MNFTLMDLNALSRTWGRGVIFRAPKWDPTGPLALSYLTDTEGDIVVNTNPELATMTLPELTGPANHDVDFLGENPVIEAPMFVTDPLLHALVGPTGSAHGGRERRGRPVEHTIAIFPEELWLNPLTNEIDRTKDFSYNGGVWTYDGEALSATKLELLDASFFLWRAVINRPPRTFHGGAGDAKKQIEPVSIQGLYHPDMPNGHHLYTSGNPYDAGIDLEGIS